MERKKIMNKIISPYWIERVLFYSLGMAFLKHIISNAINILLKYTLAVFQLIFFFFVS